MLLDQGMGALNTVLLVSSSWAVAAAVAAARNGRGTLVAPRLAIGIGFGIGFLVVKGFEYSAKFAAGITMQTNEFFMFYFVLTMVHAAHVVGGCVILFVMWRKARAGRYRPGRLKGLETGATYWHLVDLIWIVMFPLIYLLR
jgi:nitric oxide reductase NorE protein